jgi:hypothetical protein
VLSIFIATQYLVFLQRLPYYRTNLSAIPIHALEDQLGFPNQIFFGVIL